MLGSNPPCRLGVGYFWVFKKRKLAHASYYYRTPGTFFLQNQRKPTLENFRSRPLSLCSLQSISLVRNVFSKSAFFMLYKHREITWIRSISLRIYYSRGCVIKLKPMIRVRCLWLRPGIIAERVARERGSTRSAFLVICAPVSEEPSAGLNHFPIP